MSIQYTTIKPASHNSLASQFAVEIYGCCDQITDCDALQDAEEPLRGEIEWPGVDDETESIDDQGALCGLQQQLCFRDPGREART